MDNVEIGSSFTMVSQNILKVHYELKFFSLGESVVSGVETLANLDWCLQQLEQLQTYRSVSGI